MSYGDGGFYFLQPVDNGYGALEAGKKFGRYQMLYQPKGAYTAAEKKSDLKQMNTLLKKLKSDRKKATNRFVAHMRKEAQLPRAASTFSAGVTQAEASEARQVWINKKVRLITWKSNIDAALAAMNRSIKAATGRPTSAAKSGYKGGIKKKTPRSREGRTWTPSGPVDPEYVSVLEAAGAEFTPSGFAPGAPEEMLAVGEEVVVTPDGTLARVAVVTPDEISVAEGISMPEFPVSFYERYRTFILLGGAGVGAWALWKIMR